MRTEVSLGVRLGMVTTREQFRDGLSKDHRLRTTRREGLSGVQDRWACRMSMALVE